MAFFDWNHDGKKNYIDNAIEMMILDDIESEKSQPQPAYRKRAKQPKRELTEKEKETISIMGKLYFRLLAAIVVACTVFGIIFGGYTWGGIILSIAILIWYGRKWIKGKKQK